MKPHIFYPHSRRHGLKQLWRAVSKQCGFGVRIHTRRKKADSCKKYAFSKTGRSRKDNRAIDSETRTTTGAFHLVKISGNFGSAKNGKRFVGSFHWKPIPGKSGKSKKVGPFSQLERSERNFVFHLHVSRTLYQFKLLPTRQPSWCPVG